MVMLIPLFPTILQLYSPGLTTPAERCVCVCMSGGALLGLVLELILFVMDRSDLEFLSVSKYVNESKIRRGVIPEND